jgi:hypothetical protein
VNGQGAVTRDLENTIYNANEEVGLTATPETSWSFSHRSGDYSGSDNPVSIIMDANKTITAHFTIYLEDLESGFTSPTGECR